MKFAYRVWIVVPKGSKLGKFHASPDCPRLRGRKLTSVVISQDVPISKATWIDLCIYCGHKLIAFDGDEAAADERTPAEIHERVRQIVSRFVEVE